MRAASVAAIAAIAVVAAPAAHGAPRQVGSLTYTTTVPGAPTGLRLSFEFQNPDDPSLKPHSVAMMVVHRPPGGVIDTTVPAQCRASNAELMARGPSACPDDSRIGTAVVVADTGSSGPFPRYSRTNVTAFNNQDEIVAVGENEDLPLRPVDRTRIEGDRTTTNFPLIPGQPPPDPYTAFKTYQFEFPAYVRDGRTYNSTPPTCPAVGYWTMVLDFTYRDGVTETVESRSPCQQERARLRIGHRDVRVRRRGTLVELHCEGPAGARCVGALRLRPTGHSTRRSAPAGRSSMRVAFDVAGGARRRVWARIPAASRARLARRRKAVVRAVARLSDGTIVRRLLSLYR